VERSCVWSVQIDVEAALSLLQFRNRGRTERDLLQVSIEEGHDGHELHVSMRGRGSAVTRG
jgi:hypothetical protein